jgi:cupin fold WbuC family metalloprotein
MSLRKVNDEIFIAEEPIVRIGDEQIAFLKRQAQASPRRRARICAHKSNDDALHEMLIVISADSYIHPHKHLGKSESFHIVEGNVDVAVFDDAGALVDLVELGPPGSGRQFFYRLDHGAFHTLLIHGDYLVVHEVTNGPFARDRTVMASFAPKEEDAERARDYMLRVAEQARAFRAARPAGRP